MKATTKSWITNVICRYLFFFKARGDCSSFFISGGIIDISIQNFLFIAFQRHKSLLRSTDIQGNVVDEARLYELVVL